MKIIETRKLSSTALRNVCVENNWYTYGDNNAYGAILRFADAEEMTIENLTHIAEDIINHSDPKRFADCAPNGIEPIEHVLYNLAEACHSFFTRY